MTNQKQILTALFLCDQLHMGGVEQWLTNWATTSHNTNIHLTAVCTADPHSYQSPVIDRLPISIKRTSNRDTIKTLTATTDIVIAWGVKHLRQYLPIWPPYPFTVIISHGAGPWTQAWLETSIDAAHYRIAVSTDAATVYHEHCHAIAEPGININRTKPSRPRSTTRTLWGAHPEEKLLGFLGRLSPEKTPIAAAVAAKTLGPPWRSVYQADGWNAIADWNAIKTIDPRAIWVDPGAHIGDTLASIDVLISASEREGFGLSIFEAFAAGCPVACTQTGELPLIQATHGPMTTPIPFQPTANQLAAAVAAADARLLPGIEHNARRVTRLHFNHHNATTRLTKVLNTGYELWQAANSPKVEHNHKPRHPSVKSSPTK